LRLSSSNRFQKLNSLKWLILCVWVYKLSCWMIISTQHDVDTRKGWQVVSTGTDYSRPGIKSPATIAGAGTLDQPSTGVAGAKEASAMENSPPCICGKDHVPMSPETPSPQQNGRGGSASRPTLQGESVSSLACTVESHDDLSWLQWCENVWVRS